MARFLTPPTQKFVDMTPPSQTEFYANVLATAQNNMERSMAAKQEAAQYYNSLPFYTKEDYDAVIGAAQKELASAIEGDFPGPAKVVNKIIELNRKLQPGVTALKRKDEQIKLAQQGKLTLGTNYLGNDVLNMSIVGPDGNFVNPNTLTTQYYDANQIREAFMKSEGARLSAVRERGLMPASHGYLKSVTTIGLDDAEKLDLYGIDSAYSQEIAEKRLAEMPTGFEQIMGGRENAISALKQLHWEAANNPAFAFKITQDYLQPIKSDKPLAEGRSPSSNPKDPDGLFKGFISRNYVTEGQPALSREKYDKEKKTTQLDLLSKGTAADDYIKLMDKYPALYKKAVDGVTKFTAGKGYSLNQRRALVAGAFYDMIADKEISEAKIIQTYAEANPTQSGSFYSFLNNIPDTYKFESSDGKSYTKKDLASDKNLLSEHTSSSPVRMPLMEDYVEVYHKQLQKNLKVPIDALDNSVKEANDFVKKAYNIFNSNNIDEDYITYKVPIYKEEHDDGTSDPIYVTVFRQGNVPYVALSKYENNRFDIDVNTARPLNENWGMLSAIKINAFKDAYSKN